MSGRGRAGRCEAPTILADWLGTAVSASVVFDDDPLQPVAVINDRLPLADLVRFANMHDGEPVITLIPHPRQPAARAS